MKVNKSDIWKLHAEKQKAVCEKFDSNWNPITKEMIIGCSEDLSKDPLNGVRHQKENGTTGWYIWSGEFSNQKDFFKPICAEHLIQERPEIIKYLSLDVGFRFLLGENGHEDVWFDETLNVLK